MMHACLLAGVQSVSREPGSSDTSTLTVLRITVAIMYDEEKRSNTRYQIEWQTLSPDRPGRTDRQTDRRTGRRIRGKEDPLRFGCPCGRLYSMAREKYVSGYLRSRLISCTEYYTIIHHPCYTVHYISPC